MLPLFLVLSAVIVWAVMSIWRSAVKIRDRNASVRKQIIKPPTWFNGQAMQLLYDEAVLASYAYTEYMRDDLSPLEDMMARFSNDATMVTCAMKLKNSPNYISVTFRVIRDQAIYQYDHIRVIDKENKHGRNETNNPGSNRGGRYH